MLKKMMLIILLGVMGVTLFSNGGSTLTIDSLLAAGREDENITVTEVSTEYLKNLFPDVRFFVVNEYNVVRKKENRLRIFVNNVFIGNERGYNKILLQSASAKDISIEDKIKAYVYLHYWKDTFEIVDKKITYEWYTDSSGKENVREINTPKIFRNIEVSDFKVWSRKYSDYFESEIIKGVLYVTVDARKFKWVFEIKEEQIFELRAYNTQNDGYPGGVTNPIYFPKNPQRDIGFGIIDGEYSTANYPDTLGTMYNHYYIKVSEDGTTTNNSIKIRVSGLDNGENIDFLIIEIPEYTTPDSIWVNVNLTANSSGVCEYTWQPANNTKTGYARVKVIRENSDVFYWQRTYLIPEHVKKGSFNGGYNYEIYYCNQFFAGHGIYPVHPDGIEHAATFATYVDSALTNSWKKQVIEWELAKGCLNDMPIDNDGIYQVFISDADPNHSYHGTYITGAYPTASERVIGIKYSEFLDDPGYSDELSEIKITISHEFYHGIQWSLNNSLLNQSMDWMIEGQAVCISSIQNEEIEFFQSPTMNHDYRVNAAIYSQFWLKRSLTNISNLGFYMGSRYAYFWRFLYENYLEGTPKEKLAIIRETCRGNTNSNLSAIKSFMNSKLSGNGSNLSTFDVTITTFARHAYLNDPEYNLWDPCPNEDFYIKPAIADSGSLSAREQIIKIGNIDVAFGIDYMEFEITAGVNSATLQFDSDPDNDNVMSDFSIQALLFQGNTLLDTLDIALGTVEGIDKGKGVVSFKTKDKANKVVVIVCRLDTDSNRNLGDYEIKLNDGTIIPGGTVSGVWETDLSPYLIAGNVMVASGQDLVIEPGVFIEFLGHHTFTVEGRVEAAGSEIAPIVFTAQDETTGWGGMRFVSTNSNGQAESLLSFCHFEYGRATGSFPYNNGGAIHCTDSSPYIEDSIFTNNYAAGGGGAICLYNWSSPEIRRTNFSFNHAGSGGAIFAWNPMYGWSWPLFAEVEFHHNTSTSEGAVFYLYKNVYPVLYHLTLFQNSSYSAYGSAIYASDNCHFHLHNSILWQDSAPELYMDYNSTATVHNSLLTNGNESYIVGPNSNVSFEGNILSEDPRFVDIANHDFNLHWSSPCIDAGGIITLMSREKIYERSYDPDGTLPDMGSFYYLQPDFVNTPTNLNVTAAVNTIELNWTHGDGAIFYKVYSSDNPFSGFTLDESGVFNQTNWLAPANGNRKFYYVKGGNNRAGSRSYSAK
jgi:hypothetical protein